MLRRLKIWWMHYRLSRELSRMYRKRGITFKVK